MSETEAGEAPGPETATERRLRSRRSVLAKGALALLVVPGAAWTTAAVWFQTEPPLGWLWLAVVAMVAGGILLAGRRRPGRAWLALGLAAVLTGLWWASIRPSNDRDWAEDVARGVTAEIGGSEVVVHNVRAFDWRSEEDFVPRWESRRYRLDDIASVDLVSSVWDHPAIAHTLVSFGFATGEHLVFSAEIRKERHEVFSELGGFFKEFELVMIAADESDILRLRTNIRREEVSLFPLRLRPAEARALFLSYLAKGNALADTPQFYHTVTANCTTVIFQLARLIEPGIPTDWRILLSGYLPDYVHEHGGMLATLPLSEIKRRAAISRRAQQADPSLPYSRVIRTGLPEALVDGP